MAGRRTNLGLLLLFPGCLVSGYVAFGVGSGPIGLAAVGHGAIGLAVLLLVPWKAATVCRGLRRRRPDRWWSLTLALCVVVALLTGLLHSTGLLVAVGDLSAMQVHVGAALLALVPFGWHVRHRLRVRRMDLGRRNLLRAGGLAGASVAAYYSLSGAVTLLALPGAGRRATGSYHLSAAEMPAVIWLFDRVPRLDRSGYTIEVASRGTSRAVGLSEITTAGDRVTAVLDCTNGWWAEQTWSGIRISRLLRPGDTAMRTVTVISATGYSRRLPLTDDLLLADRAGGEPLTAGRGAPVRLVVPGRRGFHWVKWVRRIEFDDRPWWWQPPFPLQ